MQMKAMRKGQMMLFFFLSSKIILAKSRRKGNENPEMEWQSKAKKTQNIQSIVHKHWGKRLDQVVY